MAIQKCHKQAEFIHRIQGALGVTLGQVDCKVVDTDGMVQVMRSAGWSKNEAFGVVGFQLGNNVYVLSSAPWTVLHELIHRGGVNSDRLSRFVAEGLTEAIARELKQSADEHRPTYPTETAWVQTKLLPRLRLTAVELGQQIAHAKDPPATLADLMVAVDPSLNRSDLVRQLQPQKTEQPSFNRRGCPTRAPRRPHLPSPHGSGAAFVAPPTFSVSDDDGAAWIAGLLLVAGTALGLPIIVRRLGDGSTPPPRDRL
jgi:hypothetical protein